MNEKEKSKFQIEVELFVRRYLEKHGGNMTHTAHELGITLPTLRKVAKRGGYWPWREKAA